MRLQNSCLHPSYFQRSSDESELFIQIFEEHTFLDWSFKSHSPEIHPWSALKVDVSFSMKHNTQHTVWVQAWLPQGLTVCLQAIHSQFFFKSTQRPNCLQGKCWIRLLVSILKTKKATKKKKVKENKAKPHCCGIFCRYKLFFLTFCWV